MEILEHFFRELNECKVDYFVIGDYFDLPNYSGRTDLDLFVNSSDLKDFYKIFNRTTKLFNGRIVSCFKSNSVLHLRVLGKHNYWWGLQIDVIYAKFDFLTKEYFPLEVLKNNIILYNNIKVIDYRIGYFLGFMKELLHNKKVKEKYFITSKSEILNNQTIYKEAIIPIYGVNFWEKLITEFKKERFSVVNFSNLAYKKLFNFKIIKNLYNLRKIKFIKRIINKPGFTICFLGTDGTGKSTLISHIIPVLEEAFHNTVYYEHLRPNYLPSLARLFGKKNKTQGPITNPHSNKPSGFVGSLFRVGYYFFDYTIGYFVKIFPKKAFKSCVWIFDRYYYDYYIDQHRSLLNLPKWIIRFFQVLIPEPDIIICLGANYEIIHNRKPELSIQEVKQQVDLLSEFAKKQKRAVWIDTSTSIKESTDAVLEQIVKVMGKRFENIELY